MTPFMTVHMFMPQILPESLQGPDSMVGRVHSGE